MPSDSLPSSYVLSLEDVDRSQVAKVGGKGAHLGELSRLDGIRVPPGFCITADAYRRICAATPSIEGRINELSRLRADDGGAIGALTAEIRQQLGSAPVPDDIAEAIASQVSRIGVRPAYAVRSSATAEDSPTASFAGQQDTYLSVVGLPAILQGVKQCWASLFTERSVAYRLRNGFDHRQVHMAVVVQVMVSPDASGILFTADPTSGNRRIATIEAVLGLGAPLVSGRVSADTFKVRGEEVLSEALASKKLALRARSEGGTEEQPVPLEQQLNPALSRPQALRLVELGRRIEAHFSSPQDIEWCLAEDVFHIVQARPITTLFPIPMSNDVGNHVYVSVGHGQMMTDAMSPLGLSLFQLIAMAPMHEAGGRLFVDVTRALASPASRTGLLDTFGRGDPLIRDALQSVVDRRDFLPPAPDPAPGSAPARGASPPIEASTALAASLIAQAEASIAAMKHSIAAKSGPALLDFIREDIAELKRVLFHPQSSAVIMSGMQASWKLGDDLQGWLGEKNAADALSQSVPNNVTSEMGLALLDVADAIRPHGELVAFLEGAQDERFIDQLTRFPGGIAAQAALRTWLGTYGMRGVGEIDIARPRWIERPTTLLPLLLGHVKNAKPGASQRRFALGQEQARLKEQEVLARLRALPDGDAKAAEAKRLIDRLRSLIGYREYPKYGMVSRIFVYKQALLAEADRLVGAQVLREREEIFQLTFPELEEVARTHRLEDGLIARRKERSRANQALTPPRVLTSEGELLNGSYRRHDAPAGALIGLPVSAGIVEGRARIVRDVARANLEPGDILVTPYTDPSWTPLFVSVRGLVTEVGGLMTHGSVIAREYGLPAVVGVEQATQRIRDGQAIRVNGTDGYVEIVTA